MTHQISKRILTAEDLQVIGKLLVEILNGEVSAETREAILDLGDPRDIPPPVYDMASLLEGDHALPFRLRRLAGHLSGRRGGGGGGERERERGGGEDQS